MQKLMLALFDALSGEDCLGARFLERKGSDPPVQHRYYAESK
jgi:hypothetical protein